MKELKLPLRVHQVQPCTPVHVLDKFGDVVFTSNNSGKAPIEELVYYINLFEKVKPLLFDIDAFVGSYLCDASEMQRLGEIVDELRARDGVVALPAAWSKWKHEETGMVYTVGGLTNMDSTRREYPPSVVYSDADGKVWSRPLTRWPGKLKPYDPE